MIIYTTAPAAYDYSYMEEIATYRSTHGDEWRVLQTDDEFRCRNYQIPRYHSGLYPAYDQDTFIELGFK